LVTTTSAGTGPSKDRAMPAMLKAAFPTAITVGAMSNSGKDLRTASAGSAAATPALNAAQA